MLELGFWILISGGAFESKRLLWNERGFGSMTLSLLRLIKEKPMKIILKYENC